MPAPLLERLRELACANGFDLFGVVDSRRFDACQPKEQRIKSLLPKCGAVALVGCGGPRRDAISLAQGLQRLQVAVAREVPRIYLAEPGRCSLSFARLAEAAGFGTISPVTGLLLHPTYGPWVGVHAALLIEGNPFGPLADAAISDHFQPCCKCRQFCLEVLQEPWRACGLGRQYRDRSENPLPQIVAIRTSPFERIRVTAQRWVPRFLRP